MVRAGGPHQATYDAVVLLKIGDIWIRSVNSYCMPRTQSDFNFLSDSYT